MRCCERWSESEAFLQERVGLGEGNDAERNKGGMRNDRRPPPTSSPNSRPADRPEGRPPKYRVTMVVAHLGFVDSDLGSSPWLVGCYCNYLLPDRRVEHPKSN